LPLKSGGTLKRVALLGAEVVLEELLVELLHRRVDAVVLAVDDDAHQRHARRREELVGEPAVQHLAHERRVGVAVEQVEVAHAVQALLRVDEVEGEVERLLATGAIMNDVLPRNCTPTSR
jgi:hypothetical protein